MNTAVQGSARAEWQANWRVVVAAMAGFSLAAIPGYVVGVFIQPLEQEFGWSRAGISSALTIFALVGILGAPFAGILIDRYGARRIGLAGLIAYCVLFALLCMVGPGLSTWLGGWVLVGLAGLFAGAPTWSRAVSSFFHSGRGLAVAVMASGTGVGTMILPLFTNRVIETFGWRAAFLAIALLYAVVVLPLLWAWFRDASEGTARLEGAAARTARVAALPGWTAHEGLRRRQTWQLAAAALLATAVVSAFAMHIVQMLVAESISRDHAVGLLGFMGVTAIAARLTVGYLFDRVNHPVVGAISMALPLLPAMLLLLVPPGPGMAVIAVVALGCAVGGEFDAVVYLSSRYFGPKALGVLMGVVLSVTQVGIGLGPIVAGALFDRTHSYDGFYLLCVPVLLLAGLLVATLGRYPDHVAAAGMTESSDATEAGCARQLAPLASDR